MSTHTWDAWNYRESAEMSDPSTSLVGFSVHATDGHIGKIDEATADVGASHLVVDTGPWIFGRKVMLPAGTIERIDWDDEKVFVDRTKDQIKDSPELANASMEDPAYRDRLGAYYGETYDRGGL
ncbi:hypothetical protein N865_19570 [Intrasporangium oryzae NRRL B-24470]|uniref:PRC domain containing protein n=1 Tax=Intrasporangium oryzae NRRL B-24470 TaxID=1386089 RepID=W9G569_9MICO|nr:hypothetical protein [Intrasporangium oryzae]EWS99952.1 hypothetical protein N865_19570 [Intrasporangium oryzae NRRL B-24470]